MKKSLLTLFILVICNALFAQNIQINNLVTLRKLSPSEANDYLFAKGWSFRSSSNMVDENATVMSWTYLKTPNQISLINDTESNRLVAIYSTASLALFNNIKKEFLLKKPMKIKDSVEDDAIKSEYGYQGLRILFKITKEDETTSYMIFVSN